ncbi:MAG: hypothetical protein L0Z62_08480 [Gemmataceae bacterium]|nr:hypothetical protein [Gemmataceae bacterium]
MEWLRSWRLLPVSAWLTWPLIGLTAWVIPAASWGGRLEVALLAALAVALALVPILLRRYRRLALPRLLEVLIALQLCLHTYWGVWLRYYDAFWWWDRLLHIHGALLVSFLGFLWLYARHAAGALRLPIPLLVLFPVLLGNTLGAWWEVAEFLTDKTLGKNTQYGLDNTMWDLINNLLGSLLAAGFAWGYVRHHDAVARRSPAARVAQPIGPASLTPAPEQQVARQVQRHLPLPPTFAQQEVQS